MKTTLATPAKTNFSEKISVTQFEALCSLVSDADGQTLFTLLGQLKKILKAEPAWLIWLHDHPEALSLPTLNLLDELRWKEIEAKIKRWNLDQSFDLDLEEGLFTLSNFEDPKIKKQDISAPLDAMALELQERLDRATSSDEVIHVFCNYLFDEQDFHGDKHNYYHPQNSFIHYVLANKVGIPISLSAICLLLAKRLRWKDQPFPLVGIGLPLHFLLQFRFPNRAVFVDPFNRGKQLTYKNCTDFLKENKIPFQPHYFLPVNNHSILCRTMANLMHIYSKRGQDVKKNQIAKYLRILKRQNETAE